MCRGGGLAAAPPKPFYTADGSVPLVTPDTFPTPSGDFVTVVHFFQPGDSDDALAAQAVQAVAGKLSPSRIAKFAALDCRAHAALCERHGVAGTPAIQAVVPDADETAEFIGTISPAELKAWTLRQVPSHVTALRGQKDLDAFLEVRVPYMLRSCGRTHADGPHRAWPCCPH